MDMCMNRFMYVDFIDMCIDMFIAPLPCPAVATHALPTCTHMHCKTHTPHRTAPHARLHCTALRRTGRTAPHRIAPHVCTHALHAPHPSAPLRTPPTAHLHARLARTALHRAAPHRSAQPASQRIAGLCRAHDTRHTAIAPCHGMHPCACLNTCMCVPERMHVCA